MTEFSSPKNPDAPKVAPRPNIDQTIRFTETVFDTIKGGPQGERLAQRQNYWLGFHSELDRSVQTGVRTAEDANVIRSKIDALRDINQLHDPLTGLLTKEGISEILQMQFANAKMSGLPLTVLIADLKNFKGINDEFGHHVGDEVLSTMAKHARQSMQTSELGRYGGDEIMAIYPGKTQEEVEEIIRATEEGMPEAMRALQARHGIGRDISMDHGFVEIQPDDTFDSIIQRADERMYSKKRENKLKDSEIQ